jgi:hypothetical protein
MKTIILRPADPERDFKQITALFSLEQGELLGSNWATRSRFDARQAYFYIIAKLEKRSQGAGSRLYEDVEQAAKAKGIIQFQI